MTPGSMILGSRSKIVSILGILAVVLLVSVGTFRALTRGGNDFAVFYEAWRLVNTGRGADIYQVSPDRFLYAPGFAWILSPWGLLSKSAALATWCLAKAFLIGFLIQKLSASCQMSKNGKIGQSSLGVGLSAWGVVLIARPLLIDLEYGQVNLFILGACVWGLLGHFEKEPSLVDFPRWLLLTFAAIAKLFPLPLLLVPWCVKSGISSRKIKVERCAIIVGVLFTLLVPVITQGWSGTFHLLLDWRDAVLARGLPLESHNQSFIALLHRYLSGIPTHVIAEGAPPVLLGWKWLSSEKIRLLSLFWTMGTFGVILGWIVSGSLYSPFKWIAVLIGLLIVPSHLVWKPYFVMSMPLAIWVIHQALEKKRISLLLGILVLFTVINLTGFDFVGHQWGAHFESASLLLMAHLAMIGLVMREEATI